MKVENKVQIIQQQQEFGDEVFILSTEDDTSSNKSSKIKEFKTEAKSLISSPESPDKKKMKQQRKEVEKLKKQLMTGEFLSLYKNLTSQEDL